MTAFVKICGILIFGFSLSASTDISGNRVAVTNSSSVNWDSKRNTEYAWRATATLSALVLFSALPTMRLKCESRKACPEGIAYGSIWIPILASGALIAGMVTTVLEDAHSLEVWGDEVAGTPVQVVYKGDYSDHGDVKYHWCYLLPGEKEYAAWHRSDSLEPTYQFTSSAAGRYKVGMIKKPIDEGFVGRCKIGDWGQLVKFTLVAPQNDSLPDDGDSENTPLVSPTDFVVHCAFSDDSEPSVYKMLMCKAQTKSNSQIEWRLSSGLIGEGESLRWPFEGPDVDELEVVMRNTHDQVGRQKYELVVIDNPYLTPVNETRS